MWHSGRLKVVLHYDRKAIYSGAKRRLLHPEHYHERAFLSRCLGINSAGFYFDDAAVEGDFIEIHRESEIRELLLKVHGIAKLR